MSDLRDDAALRALAVEVLRLDGHPDVKELHKRAQKLLQEHRRSDFAALAAVVEDTEEGRAELRRSARELLASRPMARSRRIGVGLYLMTLSALTIAVTPWAWSVAMGLHAEPPVTVTVRLLRWSFVPSADFAIVVIVALMAVIGSLVVSSLVFSTRAGKETLERGYLWWYLIRPLSAAGLGVLFYLSVVAGFFQQPAQQGRGALVVAAAIGGLAGLFTDQVMAKMRGILGLKPFSVAASQDAADDAAGTSRP